MVKNLQVKHKIHELAAKLREQGSFQCLLSSGDPHELTLFDVKVHIIQLTPVAVVINISLK